MTLFQIYFYGLFTPIFESPPIQNKFFLAFACIQPPNEGYTPPGGGPTLNHWYHDPITGECRELKYLGYGGNANNFQTKDHCESYCKQSKLIYMKKDTLH